MAKKTTKKSPSKEDVIVSPKEIEQETKIQKLKKDPKDDEPEWYHYVIVLAAFVGFFAIIYFAVDYYDNRNNPEPVNQTLTYLYTYTQGNVTYNIQFHSPVEEISNLNYMIEPTKYDMLNTVTFRVSFMEYNGSDNGEVSVGATKLIAFLKRVYFVNFPVERFVLYNETNCSASSLSNKVIIFNPYTQENEVLMDSNGCIEVNSAGAENFISVVDKFLYELSIQ